MKHLINILLLSLFILNIHAQDSVMTVNTVQETVSNSNFREGEWLKYRVHFGFINAGYATLKLKKSKKNGENLYHAIGKGWTSGAARMFFKVNDTYESYFTKGKIKPVKFIRRVNEDGYIIKRDLYFNHDTKKVNIDDLKKKTKKEVTFKDVQDLVSSFYYLRDMDLSDIEEGDKVEVDLFFDGETYPFQLEFLNKEIISTKFGEIRTWRIRPHVQKGRVFEEEESLTLWITDDENKLPIRIKASLVVGSLKADLDEFKGLAHSFKIIKD